MAEETKEQAVQRIVKEMLEQKTDLTQSGIPELPELRKRVHEVNPEWEPVIDADRQKAMAAVMSAPDEPPAASLDELKNMAYELGISLDMDDTGEVLAAKIDARKTAIYAAVELVIDAKEPDAFGEDGNPTLEAVAEAMGDDAPGLKVEHVNAAAEAIWEAREDEQAEQEGSGPGAEALNDAPLTGKAPDGPSVEARPEVVEATKQIIAAEGPFERGAPALGAVRRLSGFDGTGDEPAVSKAEAAAAYEEVTGDPWPWPPTAQELAALHAATALRYPSAMYHKTKNSITVRNEAEEEKARKDGFQRDHEMEPKVWVEAWARETGATDEQKAQALESVKNDPKRRKSA